MRKKKTTTNQAGRKGGKATGPQKATWWDNLTEEEKAERIRKMQEGRRKAKEERDAE